MLTITLTKNEVTHVMNLLGEDDTPSSEKLITAILRQKQLHAEEQFQKDKNLRTARLLAEGKVSPQLLERIIG